MKYKLVDGKFIDADGNEVENPELTTDEIAEMINNSAAPVKEDNVADILTSAELHKKIEKLVDEKIELAAAATDDEEEHLEEDDEEDEKGLGLFPILLISGVAIVGAATFFLNNRPISHPTQSEE